jgi:hypothetical protein
MSQNPVSHRVIQNSDATTPSGNTEVGSRFAKFSGKEIDWPIDSKIESEQ